MLSLLALPTPSAVSSSLAGTDGVAAGLEAGGGSPCGHALFPVVAFDVDGPGHSERLIENFLRLRNGMCDGLHPAAGTAEGFIPRRNEKGRR